MDDIDRLVKSIITLIVVGYLLTLGVLLVMLAFTPADAAPLLAALFLVFSVGYSAGWSIVVLAILNYKIDKDTSR